MMSRNENDITYFVTIEKHGTGKNTELTGILTLHYFEYAKPSSDELFIPIEKINKISFNPLTILFDLRNVDSIPIYAPNTLVNKLSLKNPSTYNKEYAFKQPLYIDDPHRYCKLINTLSNLFKKNDTNEALTLLKDIHKTFNLTPDCTISVFKEEEFKEISNPKLKSISKTLYKKPLIFNPIDLSSQTLDNSFLSEDHIFNYKCNNMTEVIYAIFHFNTIHNYEIQTCLHCQKKFYKIPTNGQKKYCPRISPLLFSDMYFKSEKTDYKLKFKQKTCADAVSIFFQIMRNYKKSKLKNFERNGNIDKNFHDKYDHLHKVAIYSPTISNLVEFYNFAHNYKFTQKKKDAHI